MKRIFTYIVALCISAMAFANTQGHYWLQVVDQNITVNQASEHFSKWFSLSEDMTFQIFSDETDAIGMRHIAYQQYWMGAKVEHNMIIVHARNGQVVSVNAAIMVAEQQPQAIRSRMNKKQAMQHVANGVYTSDAMVIQCTLNGEQTYRIAYRVLDIKANEDVYIDAETGAVLKRISHLRSADVITQGHTMYNGWQTMTVDKTSAGYQLEDNGRKIKTLDAKQTDVTILQEFYNTWADPGYNSWDELIADAQEGFDQMVNTCKPIVYDNIPCDGAAQLMSVTVSETPNTSWWNADGNLYLVCEIYDLNDNLIYDPGYYYYNNSGIPITYPFYKIEDYPTDLFAKHDKVKLKIYDYDPDAGSTLGAEVIVDKNSRGKVQFETSKVKGWCMIYGNADLDAHWGMQKTYDFYKEIFNRNSFDDQGTEILQMLFPPANDYFSTMPDNAYAQSFAYYEDTPLKGVLRNHMVYGIGDSSYMSPVVALDVMAHEFTHIVTDYNGKLGLEYAGESGALNESFSDIFGFSVEHYVLGDTDYLIGEDVMIRDPFMRSMKEPKQAYQPDTYQGQYWADITDMSETGDNGGVHINSGVQNKWFYLLSEGGTGTNDKGNAYTVQGISIEKAQQIAYRNLMNYLTPTATHADARAGSLQAAEDLYGKDSPEYISTANAWYAVGVGNSAEDDENGGNEGGEENDDFSYDWEPTDQYAFNEVATYAEGEPIISDDGAYTAAFVALQNESTLTWLYFNVDPATFATEHLPSGRYPINDTGNPYTVFSSRGGTATTEDPSMFAVFVENGQYVPFYIMSGTVTVSKANKDYTINVLAQSYFGSEIVLTYTGEIKWSDETAVEDVPISTGDNKYKVFENGQIYIIRDGIKYNVLGTRIQ